ncbi:MAG TPA: asparagine synthetase B [Candidatus Acidoferrales bacterium]|nr:asparagine synthetase B [Candidatus Acidoferrales bacterium]
MSAIVGITANKNANVEVLLEEMLDSLKHRGTIRENGMLTTNGCNSILGCATHNQHSPILGRSQTTTVVVDGSFFEHSEFGAAEFVRNLMAGSSSSLNALRQAVSEIGGFACIVNKGKQAYAFRDINGLKPLYYGLGYGLTAVASERKALWRIGLKQVRRIPPGYLCSLSKTGVRKTRVVWFRRSKEKSMTIDEASSKLEQMLVRSIQRITRKGDKVAVAFSGGLDSALTAALAKKEGVKVEAVSVGLPDSTELSTVENYAKQLDLPITMETFSLDSLEQYVRRVLWLIEEANLMKVSVAVPLHWAAIVAARRGYRVMLCGQGSDELYGGYTKYARTLGTEGRRALASQLYRSVVESSQVNYERDDQACAPLDVELRTPFSDPDLIRFSLTVPSEFKVKDQDDVTRKWVLREVAKRVGLPDEITWRRKKAIQHGTGVENALRRLAKRQSLTVEQYLSKMFEEVINLTSMP